MIHFTFYDNSDDNGNESETFGPYTDAQMTYAGLRVDDDRNLAHYDGLFWWVTDDTGTRRFTDFVIHHDDSDADTDRLLAEARKPYADKIMELERLLRHANGTLAHLEHGINEHRRVERNLMEDA